MTEQATGTGSGLDARAGFEVAYAETRDAVSRYASVILGPQRREALPDVLQDAWARAWAAWPPTDLGRREAWLFRIVRNRCVDEHRRARRRTLRLDEVAEPPAGDDPASDAVAEDVLRLLGTLPPALRETLWLRAVEQRSYAEIAALLDVPIGTVMSRLHAARARLARELGR